MTDTSKVTGSGLGFRKSEREKRDKGEGEMIFWKGKVQVNEKNIAVQLYSKRPI